MVTTTFPHNIRIVLAQSILGLKPTGVETLGDALLAAGLQQSIGALPEIITVAPLNQQYRYDRDTETKCLNVIPLLNFSQSLGESILPVLQRGEFPLVLGGDCSILIGILSGLKPAGKFGLIFFDAHADFYQPEASTTGEAADMDLAIVTGRGPDTLTNINGQKPYVHEMLVVHMGQRDQEETKHYGSPDVCDTEITCINLETINTSLTDAAARMMQRVNELSVDGLWIHFDTDVLSDEINPAVDYRLPGGLTYEQLETLMTNLFNTGKIIGMSITILNPKRDHDGSITKGLVQFIGKVIKQKVAAKK